MIELHIILILMIAAAVVAMQIESLLSSVIALGAVGFGLTLEFLLLKAPDLAITQLVIEILTVIILIKATVNADMHPRKIDSGWGYISVGVLFVAFFLIFSQKALVQIPDFGHALMKIGSQYADQAVIKTSAANVVSAVILDFRAYDTLGEVTVLFASVVGVLAVLRKKGRKS